VHWYTNLHRGSVHRYHRVPPSHAFVSLKTSFRIYNFEIKCIVLMSSKSGVTALSTYCTTVVWLRKIWKDEIAKENRNEGHRTPTGRCRVRSTIKHLFLPAIVRAGIFLT
jgi:hypothetical protein